MNAAQTAATFEIQTTPVLACDDPLCMSCAGDGICGAARKPIPEIERESAAGEARLADVEAEYDASRSAAARVPLDGPVVSSLTREGAAALVDVLALLLGDVPPPAPAPGRAPRPRAKRSPRPSVPTPAGKPAMLSPIDSIERAKPASRPLHTEARSLHQRERTALIRQALRQAGVVGASVTMARGSMCFWSEVRVAGQPHGDVDWRNHEAVNCLICRRNLMAERKIGAIILAALPDMGDRSDSQSDHFDFMFTVTVDRG